MYLVLEIGSVGVDAVAAVSAAFKELFGHCAKLGIGKNIFLLLGKGLYLFSDKINAESVFEMIDSFPDKSENMYVFESAVSKAGICYFALTEEQRNAVSNFDKLKSAAGQLSNSSGFWLYGDANLDGSVNITDALHTLQCAVKLRNFNTKQKKLCDIDEDGMITVTDALKILQFACRIPFPTLPRK